MGTVSDSSLVSDSRVFVSDSRLDADKHGPSLKNALVGAASFYKSMLDMPYSEIRLVASPFLRTHWDHTSKSCVSLAIPPVVSHILRPEWIRALDRAFRDCTEETPWHRSRCSDRFTASRHGRIPGSTHRWTASALSATTQWWRKNDLSSHPSRTNNIESASTTSKYIPIIRQSDVIDFPFSSRSEWTTPRTFCSFDEHPPDCHAAVHVFAGKAVVPRVVLCVQEWSRWPRHCAPQTVFLFHHWWKWNRGRRAKLLGNRWGHRRGRIYKVSTQKLNSGFWALRVRRAS